MIAAMSVLRFEPPSVAISPVVEWLLWRAFGASEGEATSPGELNEAAIVSLGELGDLLARVGARTPPGALEEEIGPAGAATIARELQVAAARWVQHRGLLRQVAGVAVEQGIRVAVLKGGALAALGVSAPGARQITDVDVLAAEDGAQRLQAALRDRGFVDADLRGSEHQLEPLFHPSGAMVEVHVAMRGVRVDGRRSARFADLEGAGLLVGGPGLPEGCFAPARSALLAHLLVHGLGQHGLAPDSYPLARMLADVADLGVSDAEWKAFRRRGFGWIEHEVTWAEVQAARELVGRLEAGESAGAIVAGDDGAGVLLRHLVVGATDAEYRQSLKLRGIFERSTEQGGVRGRVDLIRKAVWPTRGQLDLIYGPPDSPLGYVGLRLWRPFDLALRTVRTLAARRSTRRR